MPRNEQRQRLNQHFTRGDSLHDTEAFRPRDKRSSTDSGHCLAIQYYTSQHKSHALRNPNMATTIIVLSKPVQSIAPDYRLTCKRSAQLEQGLVL